MLSKQLLVYVIASLSSLQPIVGELYFMKISTVHVYTYVGTFNVYNYRNLVLISGSLSVLVIIHLFTVARLLEGFLGYNM